MKTLIFITILVLSVGFANAQSEVGLSLSTSQNKAEKYRLIDDADLILSKATIIKYLEPWEENLENNYSDKDEILLRYPTEPRLMIEYAINERYKATRNDFIPIGNDKFDYPIKAYDDFGSMILSMLLGN